MSKYATFSGRASRGEFWWFYLFCILLSWAATIVDAVAFRNGGVVGSIVSLALFLPSLAAGCRRLHDVGRSGWWQLLIITVIGVLVLIYWWATETSKQDNKFGMYTTQPTS